MRKQSVHFKEMLKERKISSEWVEQTLKNPDQLEHKDDGTTHYIKKILEYKGRWLRVVVNEDKVPPKLVTTFFDRKLRRQHYENKS